MSRNLQYRSRIDNVIPSSRMNFAGGHAESDSVFVGDRSDRSIVGGGHVKSAHRRSRQASLRENIRNVHASAVVSRIPRLTRFYPHRSDNVLYTVSWWNLTYVTATWTNRVQNQSQLVLYDTQGTGNNVWYDEEREGWLQPNSPVRIRNCVLLLRREDSGTNAGKFRHIVR